MKRLVYALIGMLLALLLAGQVFAQEPTALQLQYDDRKDLETLLGTSVEQVTITEQMPTSFRVGTQQKDAQVLQYDAQTGILYAVGTGTARLTVDGTEYAVTVTPATLSLVMYTGHSVGHGACGSAAQSVVVEAGQAYSSFDPKSLDTTQTEGYGLGWGSEKRVGDKDVYVTGGGTGHIDAFSEEKNGTRGSGSALAWQWNNLTGEKLWVINVAVGGSCLNEWLPDASWHSTDYSDYYNTAVEMYSYAQGIIAQEIAAGHYTLGHMGILYYCGANDKYYPGWTQETIEQNYAKLWESFSEDLSADVDGDGIAEAPEFMGLVPYWVVSLREKLNFDKAAAQYMASSAEYPYIFIASNMLRQFMYDENLEDFPAIGYTAQSAAVTAPTSVAWAEGESCVMADDGAHPTQVSYNAIGIDTANNLYAWLSNGDTEPTELTLVDEFCTELGDSLTVKVGEPKLIAPWFAPDHVDDLTYSIAGNAELSYPLQVVGTAPGTAQLTVSRKGQVLKTLDILVVEGHGDHCVCGGDLEGTAAQQHGTCTAEDSWVPLDTKYKRWHEYEKSAGTNDFAQVLLPGNYYLEADMTWSGSICVAPGETVNICLNGHKLTTTGRAFIVNGTLNICDCTGNGQVYSQSTGASPVAYVGCSGQWNIYGGSYSAAAPGVREYAGVATVGTDRLSCNYSHSHVGGTIRLYDGILYGSDLTCTDGSAEAEGNGGCIKVRTQDSSFCMYGGMLSGGSTVGGNRGGGLIAGIGIVELWGGKLCNSTDALGAVYCRVGQVRIKGEVTFENNQNADIYVAAGKPALLEAAQKGDITVAINTAGLTQPAVTTAYELAGCIQSAEGTVSIWQNGGVYLTDPQSLEGQHIHCICGGKAVGVGDHRCMNVLYTAWEDGTKLPTSGTYYLAGAVTTSTRCDVNAPLQLCLNGQQVTHSYRVFNLKQATVDLCDCNEKEGSITSSYNGTQALIFTEIVGVTGGSSFNLYSGNLIHTGNVADNASAITEAPVQINGYAPNNARGILRMYGGTIRGGTTAATGATIQIQASSTNLGGLFYMYGGTVIGGTAVNGGALSLVHKGSQAYLYGGTIQGGTATGCGGNIYVENGRLYMYGTTVTGGQATEGGNLAVKSENAWIYLLGGTIEKGTATKGFGGNVSINGATSLEVRNMTLAHGWSTLRGGNMYLTGVSPVTIEDTTFTGGAANYGGNLLIYQNVACTLKNCMFTGGMADSDGFSRDAATGQMLHTGTTTNDGGNIYYLAGTDKVLTLTGCTLQGGVARTRSTELHTTAPTVINGGTRLQGYMACATHLTLGDATVTKTLTCITQDELQIRLIGDVAVKTLSISKDTYLDLNGNTFTGAVSGSATLYGLDSATDSYTTASMGRITGSVTCPVAGNFSTTINGPVRRYLAIADDNGYTFHRFYLGITHMSLKPADLSVGYKAVFYGDEMVCQQVTGYGYHLWVDGSEKVTAGKEGAFVSGQPLTLRLSNFDVANHGETEIFGQVYLNFANGTSAVSGTYSYTLRSMLEQIAEDLDSFSEAQIRAMRWLVNLFSQATADWKVDSIRKYS